MKAVRLHEFGNEEVLRLEEIPDPIPTDGEALVRIKVAAVNPGDMTIRAGRWSLWPIPLPFVLGSEGAGIVEQGGGRFKAGDQVIISGGGLGMQKDGLYVERAAVSETLLAPLPPGLSLEQAAAAPLGFLTAYLALTHTLGLRAGEWALITGASGSVGGTGVQIAKALGAKVITVVSSRAKYDKALALGAEHVIDLATEEMSVGVQRVTNGHGADAVFDSVGGEMAARALAAAAPGGRVALAGYSAGVISSISILDLLKPITLYGFNLFAIPPELIGAAFGQMLAWLADGTVKPVVDRAFPLAQAAEAHRHLASRRAFGKVVLTV